MLVYQRVSCSEPCKLCQSCMGVPARQAVAVNCMDLCAAWCLFCVGGFPFLVRGSERIQYDL